MLEDAILMQLDQQGRMNFKHFIDLLIVFLKIMNQLNEITANFLVLLACSGPRSMHHDHVTQLIPVCQCQLTLISIPSLSLSMPTNHDYVEILLHSMSPCRRLKRSRDSHLSVGLSSVIFDRPMSRSQKPFTKMWKSPLMTADAMNQWFPAFKPADVTLETSLRQN